MLRRPGQGSPDASESGAQETGFPTLNEAFALDDRPCGIRFYKGRTGFYHPYALLQSMRLEGEELTLSFATAEVSITGRGLHALFVHLSEQRVATVIEQGERYAGNSEAPVYVNRISEVTK